MKDIDLQRIVKIKHDKGVGPIKIFRDLEGVVSLRTINIWIESIKVTGCVNLEATWSATNSSNKKNY